MKDSEVYNAQVQAKKAVEQLKTYCNRFNEWCKAYDGDETCIFDKGEFCVLNEYSPDKYPPMHWELSQEGENEK